MPFFTLAEIFDIVVMTVVVGYIFSGLFKRPVEEDYDPLKHFKAGFDIKDLKFAILITAPAIILHELGHKFVALSFGLEAVFQAAWLFLGLALILKLMNFGFIFVVPAYVSILGRATPLEFGLIAFCGACSESIFMASNCTCAEKKFIANKIQCSFSTYKQNKYVLVYL